MVGLLHYIINFSHKLRRVVRKVLQLSERVFQHKRLPYEVAPVVAEILGEVYPEMHQKMGDILVLIRNEADIIDSLKGGHEIRVVLGQYDRVQDSIDESDFYDNIGLLPALKDFRQTKSSFPSKNDFPVDYVMRLYGTFGLNEDLIRRLGRLENVQLHEGTFAKAKSMLTKNGKEVLLRRQGGFNDGKVESLVKEIPKRFPATNDEAKYNYIYTESGTFAVEPVRSKIIGLLYGNEFLTEIDHIPAANQEVYVLLEKTNFYCESGGQECDTGKIITANGSSMDVANAVAIDDRILHVVQNLSGKLSIGDTVRVSIDSERRTANSVHHTATHLLNTVMRNVLNTIVYQKSSSVKEEALKLELAVIGIDRLSGEDILKVEKTVQNLIQSDCPVVTRIIQFEELSRRNDIVTVPGEIYPEDNLRLVSIEADRFKSLELCCGTHVRNLNQIEDFSITNVKLVSRGTYQITAVAGASAAKTNAMGRQMKSDVETIKMDLHAGKLQIENLETRVHRLKSILQQGFQKNFNIPYLTKMECLGILNDISKEIRDVSRETLKEFIEIEVNTVLQDRPKEEYPFIVHNLTSSALMEDVKLQKATRLCPDRPILVMCVTGDLVKARACVPAQLTSDKFNAERWLAKVANIFKGSVAAPKGQNAALVCNMRPIKVKSSIVEEQIEEALSEATEFAQRNL